jgi:hypothetical protein
MEFVADALAAIRPTRTLRFVFAILRRTFLGVLAVSFGEVFLVVARDRLVPFGGIIPPIVE